MRQSSARRAALACGLSIACGTVLADGSGTLNDSALSLSYTSEPYVMANQVGYNTGTQVCEEGTPTCDVYTLTVEFSDAWRSDPANANAYLEFLVSSTGDFDFYVMDSSGAQIAASENEGDEYLELFPDELPNGTYKLWLVPYLAAADTADLGIAVKDAGSKSGLAAVFGGGLAPALLLPFGMLALWRRRAKRSKNFSRRVPMNIRKFWLLPLSAVLALSVVMAAQAEDACTAPGVIVTEDVSGDDVTAPTGEGFADILFVHGAEPAGTNTLVLTYQVASLATVPPHTAWILRFATDTPPDNGDEDYFVAMVTLSDGFIRYVYGTDGFAAGAPAGEPRQFRVQGELDGSSYAEDGSITLVLDKSKVPALNPGLDVFNILATVRVVTPAEDGTPFFTNADNNTILDDAPAGFYTVVGNDSCAGKSGLQQVLAGAWSPFALLMLLLPALRRRSHL